MSSEQGQLDSKWGPSHSADLPLVDVARKVLRARLRGTWNHLPPAAKGLPSDIEVVHQLRVSSRRAAAAMRVFSDLLPRRRGRWMKRSLRRIRQAAGDARDLDVLALRVTSWADTATEARYESLLEQMRQRRLDAQQPIARIYDRLQRKDFPQRISELTSRASWRRRCGDRGSFGQAASRIMAESVERFFEATPSSDNLEALHHFRIEAKRLRYVMEIFAGTFDASLRDELYPTIRKLQNRVGTVIDCSAAQCHLSKWTESGDARQRAVCESLIQQQRTAEQESHAAFLVWWNKKRQTGLCRKFKQLLG